ncbi:MAG: acyl-CoA synthetase (AMP-forming)/AMP-acid ligase II [Myxococcota bacterium]|jgi:acyl-CoA synthetase (AMP-forming)/AMP-acid ligase II
MPNVPQPVRSPSGGTLVEVLRMRAEATPNALAFSDEGERLTWVALAGAATDAAKALTSAGVVAGDVVALSIPTSPRFLGFFLGSQMLGAVPIAFDPGLPIATRARRCQVLGPRVVVEADGIHPQAVDHRSQLAHHEGGHASSTIGLRLLDEGIEVLA